MESPPWSLNYMKHQRDGAFWRPLRPIENAGSAGLLIGGMQDGYRDSIPRMLDGVKAPLKAWIGPWNHGFPNDSDYDRCMNGATKRCDGSTTGSRDATPASSRTRES